MRSVLHTSLMKPLVRTSNTTFGNELGVKWLAATVRKKQNVTTTVLVDPADIVGLPVNGIERVAMRVAGHVKIDVHQDVQAAVAAPVLAALMYGL